jgi:hypothetical protein
MSARDPKSYYRKERKELPKAAKKINYALAELDKL